MTDFIAAAINQSDADRLIHSSSKQVSDESEIEIAH